MQVSRKSWHFKIFNWFDKGKTPRIIDLCSYCRTIVLWAPLKAVSLYLFYKPIAWFYGRNKLSGYLVAFCLATGIAIILGLVIRGWFWPFVFVYIVFIIFFTALDESEAIRADLKKAKETKIGEYTVKGIQVIKNGLLGTIFWLLKIVFYTIWKKLYHLHQVLFWMVLTATVAAIGYRTLDKARRIKNLLRNKLRSPSMKKFLIYANKPETPLIISAFSHLLFSNGSKI